MSKAKRLKNKTKCLACNDWQLRPPVRHFSGEVKWGSKTAQRKVGV